jgi:hypothetical protein
MPWPLRRPPTRHHLAVSPAEAGHRRIFAVISHPDAGKSTLTEALALHARVITEAGAVHGKAGRAVQSCSVGAHGCHPTWLKSLRTSARILMRALDSGSAAVRVWLSASIFTMRWLRILRTNFFMPQRV